MYLEASIFTKIPFGVIYNSLRSTQGLFSTAPKNGLMCRTSFPKVILSSFKHGIFNRYMVKRASPTKYTLIVVILVVPLAEKGTIPRMCAAGNFTAWFLRAKTGVSGFGTPNSSVCCGGSRILRTRMVLSSPHELPTLEVAKESTYFHRGVRTTVTPPKAPRCPVTKFPGIAMICPVADVRITRWCEALLWKNLVGRGEFRLAWHLFSAQLSVFVVS